MSDQPASASHEVRRFELRDVPAIEAILAESPGAAAWSTHSLEQLTAANRLAWVIESRLTVIGFLAARWVFNDEAEILNLAVAASHRRRGAADRLLQEAIAELTLAQVRKLHLEVRESNHPAISFYEKNNFTRIGRRPNYYRDPDESAVLLVKELTG